MKSTPGSWQQAAAAPLPVASVALAPAAVAADDTGGQRVAHCGGYILAGWWSIM